MLVAGRLGSTPTPDTLLLLPSGSSVSGVETWVWKLATRLSGRGDGAESKRPATNLSDFTVGSNKLGRLVEKVGSRAKTAK